MQKGEEEEEEAEVGRGEEGEEEEEGLKPWEQHSAVISLPRFDYRTPSLLLETSHSGFLITCPIKREKSATKEAISILEKYIGSLIGRGSENLDTSDADVPTKKRKIFLANGEYDSSTQEKEFTNHVEFPGEVAKEISSSSLKTCENVTRRLNLSLVKLTRSGLLLFTFANDGCPHAVKVLSNIFHSLGSGNLKPPLWCHRIIPIQGTCTLKEEDLCRVVSKLVKQYIAEEQTKLQRPIKFAVGYNRRGLDEVEVKTQKMTSKTSNGLALLERDDCFKVVAKAVKDVAADSIVDLRSPELVVLVELLPISGVPPGSLVVGVSILPHNLITTKPRLSVKALVSDTKPTKRKV